MEQQKRMVLMAALVAALLMLSACVTATNELESKKAASAPSPLSEEAILPNPDKCWEALKSVPGCADAIVHFNLGKLTKDCCITIVDITDDCLGLITGNFYTKLILKTACQAL
ncbi:PREDICTED: uncharacterized protein LOC104817592 [Tarenaya hassleriana]|uniref:uncharacterized protein LOC104817591 n=1 Tax=Tarenaya hassleriana TaxID=28532 RepID=UPI00053C59DA|nr:PREDICTED: uncharacterized protein LOC104817591 [Tarenaya hassleriana]XP_010545144.1 PREDICTED: uncharacterized protein LOC104817592 [Tarenaya hassleriana]